MDKTIKVNFNGKEEDVVIKKMSLGEKDEYQSKIVRVLS